VLAENPTHIDIHYLERFPEFAQFRTRPSKKEEEKKDAEGDDISTPEERLEDAYQQLRDQLADSLLAQIKECSPTFFEKLVVDCRRQSPEELAESIVKDIEEYVEDTPRSDDITMLIIKRNQ